MQKGASMSAAEAVSSSLDPVVSWLEQTIRQLVDHPEQVVITPIGRGRNIVLEVRVPDVDVRKVIGHKGRYADAIRDLLEAMGGKRRKNYILEIIENY